MTVMYSENTGLLTVTKHIHLGSVDLLRKLKKYETLL